MSACLCGECGILAGSRNTWNTTWNTRFKGHGTSNGRRKSAHLALSDGDGAELAAFQDDQLHVAFGHVEELLALFQVEVFALVGTAHVKHLQLVRVPGFFSFLFEFNSTSIRNYL